VSGLYVVEFSGERDFGIASQLNMAKENSSWRRSLRAKCFLFYVSAIVR